MGVHYLKTLKIFSLDAFIASTFAYLALSWFEWNSPQSVSDYFDHHWLLTISILSLLFFSLKFEFVEKKLGTFFLASIFVLTASEILPTLLKSHTFGTGFLEKLQALLWVFCVLFGAILLLKNRKTAIKATDKGKNWDQFASYKNGLLQVTIKKPWKYEIALFGLIVVLFLATVPLLKDFIGGDEWHMYNLAKMIAETGQLETEWNFFHGQPDFSYKQETLPSIHLAVWFKLFGESIPVAHLSSFLIAILLIISAFLVTRSIFNKQAGLLIVVLIATNPFFVWHSIYIRGYIYLLLFSLWACWLLLLIGIEKSLKKIIFYLVLFFLLLILMKDIRVFSIVLIVPLMIILTYRIYAKYSDHLSRNAKISIFSLLALLSSSAFIILPKVKDQLPYSGNGFKEELGLSLLALKLGFFTFPMLSATAMIFAVALFAFLGAKQNLQLGKFSKKYFLLLTIWGTVNFIYCYFSNEKLLIPRYIAPVIMLNLILLIAGGHLLLLSLIKDRNKALGLGVLLVILANGLFWTTDNLHGWSSGYNLTDIYKNDASTAHGRIPEKVDIMYGILGEYFAQRQPEKVALLTEYYLDPRMEALSERRGAVDLIALRKIPYGTKLVENIPENYEQSERSPIKKEYLEKILSVYDSTIIVFQTRKAYKFTEQIKYVEELGFQKLSGAGMDNSGVEIFVKEN